PEVFFGGYGEPLSHPDIIDMISKVKILGVRAGLVSNGTLLSPALSQDLIQSGLDKLWISVDNIHQDSILEYHGSHSQQNVLKNLRVFMDLKSDRQKGPEVGLVFVLTKSNSSQAQDVLDMGISLGVKSFFITNLEALSEEMADETPYKVEQLRRPGSWLSAQSNLIKEFQSAVDGISIEGSLVNPTILCPFAEKGEIALRWDGEVSPCLPLLYDHVSFVDSWKHQVDSYSIGNIQSRSIQEIWTDREFKTLRDHLLGDNFSPCLSCQNCWLSEDNHLDCMGYEHPTCGGCLWAKGLITCP
ncbi:MAG: SPASM domain-containing protein, partial [Anaerolineales bacterium]|nr:SPASM domain-containing protein [Anaerolineales bacterium]